MSAFATVALVLLTFSGGAEQFAHVAFPHKFEFNLPDTCSIMVDERNQVQMGRCFDHGKQVYYGPIIILTETI